MDIARIEKKVKFIHKRPENYQSYYVNGVFGAVTPREEFEMNFYFEHSRDIPDEQIINYDEEGNPIPGEIPFDVVITREFKVGIILSLEEAEIIGNWLINSINNYRKLQEKSANK